MKIGTWNTNFWKKRWDEPAQEKDQNDIKNWTINSGNIIKEYDFDFLLLQETIPHFYNYFPEYNIYFNPIINEEYDNPSYFSCSKINSYYNIETNVFKQDFCPIYEIQNTKLRPFDKWWGNAILSKKEYQLMYYYAFKKIYPGSSGLMCYIFNCSTTYKPEPICLINIYGKKDMTDIKNDYGKNSPFYHTTIHHILSDIEPIICKNIDIKIILGGDFNVNERDDETIFARIEKTGLKNYSKNEITYYPTQGQNRQDDYIFSNVELLNNCKNIYDDCIKNVSDHSMLILYI
jgi:hypothetical protein